jgi:phosphoribosylformylglycinamidine synthase
MFRTFRTFRIDVTYRSSEQDNKNLVEMAHQLGAAGVTACRVAHLSFLQGDLTAEDVEQLTRELLADPVTEVYRITLYEGNEGNSHGGQEQTGAEGYPAEGYPIEGYPIDEEGTPPSHTVDVTLLPGVTDPAAENLRRAAHSLGMTGLTQVATGQRFLLWGEVSEQELEQLAVGLFSNPVIQRYAIGSEISPPFVPTQQPDHTVETVALREADDEQLQAISTERRLALDLREMQAIRDYYQRENRDPTDAELETLAQTWSEHCVHKTFRASITFQSDEPEMVIDDMLNTFIRGATDRISKPWVHSAFVDNAGVIAFDDCWDLAFKVETHNHPSALEPFGGANTGVGGVVRDVLGVSARPIANTDVLCFGPPDLPKEEIPDGVLPPKRVAEGVIHGVEDYGNKMGIPTVNGAVLYHQGYTANPLVFCGCLGLLPRNSHPTTPQEGDHIIVVGGRTGRDGLRGATFSSMEMDQTTSEIAGSAVQIGHPIHEKQVLEAVLRARDEKLYHAITDCGAGGLASAVGEMGKQLGARVQLETVPLKYPGLSPWEIWLSEAQERMVLSVSPEAWPRLKEICDGQDIEAVSIGQFEKSGRLQLFYEATQVGDLDMKFLHDGLPRREMAAEWVEVVEKPIGLEFLDPKAPEEAPDVDLTPSLLALLSHPNIRSKEDVVHRYDHEVQGGTTVKPLVGVANHGPSDAAVLVPFDSVSDAIPGSAGTLTGTLTGAGATTTHINEGRPTQGVALGVGVNPMIGEVDPYAMAWAAIDEAIRNVVAVGADPDRIALLDNFCWGNPKLPDRLGSLVRCVQGCYDAAVAYEAPFISGKDSLNNEYTGTDGKKHAIPGTLLISALGIVPDVRRTATMDLKRAGNLLYIVGMTRNELGGSHYRMICTHSDDSACSHQAPQSVLSPLKRLRAVYRAMRAGVVQSCHDCSEGGFGVAIAEMCLAGRLGAEIDLTKLPASDDITRDDVLLFSESLSRFIIEVAPEDAEQCEQVLGDVMYAKIGHVTPAPSSSDGPRLVIRSHSGKDVVATDIHKLEAAWRGYPPPAPEEYHTADTADDEVEAAETAETDSVIDGVEQDALPMTYDVHPVTTQPRVLILHANGTNRDREAALACSLVGGQSEVVHINQLLSGERALLDYQMLVVPGGFSYGDDLGAGTLWAFDIQHRLREQVTTFVAEGRPVLGICNGFQTLVKSGLLPGTHQSNEDRRVTLAPNHSRRFECRWVYLRPNATSPCLFTKGIETLIYCPVAHAEGRVATKNDAELAELQANSLDALTYADRYGEPVTYPGNPNGSVAGIAGLCNPAGNVFGLMPHPEDHVFPWQHPRWRRGETGFAGLKLFENGVRAC